jgi:predicted nucleic-acid-binding Zn-ribbon protein
MSQQQWTCLKCGSSDFETDQLRATGGIWSKILDIQNKKFTTVSCVRCGYTEMYKRRSSKIGNVFDFLTN